MILQIAISNWRSIRDKVVLNFRAVPGEVHAPGQVVDVPGVGPVLRAIGIYGANASGKSNVLGAMGFFGALVSLGRRPGMWVSPDQWAFGDSSEESTYEVEFATDEGVFAYGLIVDALAVREEWLVRLHGDDEEVIFHRKAGFPRPSVIWGDPRWLGGRSEFYGFLAEGLRNEQPLASEIRERNGIEVLEILQRFFAAPMALDGVGTDLPFMLHVVPAAFVTAQHLVRSSDVRLADLQVHVEGSTPDTARGDIDVAFQAWRRGDLRLRLEVLHRLPNGEARWLDERSISDGTRRLLHLSLIFSPMDSPGLDSLRVVDELDNSLHPLLAADLLRRFLQPDLPSPRSQLLFTTHDTTLLDTHLLGRDGVWLTERDASGATRLFPLTSYAREDLDKLDGRLEVAYLAGHFGAIPVLGRGSR